MGLNRCEDLVGLGCGNRSKSIRLRIAARGCYTLLTYLASNRL